MFKLDVSTKRRGDVLTIKKAGRIGGDPKIVIVEMEYVLKEFYVIDDGEMLSIAMGLMLEGLDDDKRNS